MLIGPLKNRRSNAKTAYGLMSDIVAYILEEPKRVWMGNWIIQGHSTIEAIFDTEGPICGTVGCIAGNALMLTSGARGRAKGSVYGTAIDLLSDDNEGLSTHLTSLFLDTDVDANYGTKKYARIVAKRIADFQAEHEAELRAVKVAK